MRKSLCTRNNFLVLLTSNYNEKIKKKVTLPETWRLAKTVTGFSKRATCFELQSEPFWNFNLNLFRTPVWTCLELQSEPFWNSSLNLFGTSVWTFFWKSPVWSFLIIAKGYFLFLIKFFYQIKWFLRPEPDQNHTFSLFWRGNSRLFLHVIIRINEQTAWVSKSPRHVTS